MLGELGNQEVRVGKGLNLLGVDKWMSFFLHRKANKWLMRHCKVFCSKNKTKTKQKTQQQSEERG